MESVLIKGRKTWKINSSVLIKGRKTQKNQLVVRGGESARELWLSMTNQYHFIRTFFTYKYTFSYTLQIYSHQFQALDFLYFIPLFNGNISLGQNKGDQVGRQVGRYLVFQVGIENQVLSKVFNMLTLFLPLPSYKFSQLYLN